MSERTPIVSCIIIFLNEERFLSEAIDSVLAQDFPDLELLLVDDGSRDASSSIARRYAAQNRERVRYLSHPDGANRGRSASRNLGLAHSRGQFIAFLDGDDVWLPGKVAAQVALFERNPEAAMVCGATTYWSSWNDPSARDETRQVGASLDALIPPVESLKLLYPLGRGCSPSTSGFMVRREVAETVGRFEEAFTGLYDDQAFQVKIYSKYAIYVSSECFDRYRQHADSCVQRADASGGREAARGIFLEWLRGYFEREGYPDREVRRLLFRALLPYQYPRLRRVAKTMRAFGRLALGSA